MCHPQQVTQQGQRPIDGRVGQAALDGVGTLADRPYERQPLVFVLTDSAGCDVAQRCVGPELCLQRFQLTLVLGKCALAGLGHEVALDGLFERDAGALRLYWLDLQQLLCQFGLGLLACPVSTVALHLLALDLEGEAPCLALRTLARDLP